QATGTVQARVDDRKQAAPAPDQLKLSQGSMQASAPEAADSSRTQQRDAAARVAELARNVEELKRLQSDTASAAPAPAVAAASAPVAEAAPAVTPPAPTASRPVAAAPRPAPVPEPAPSLIDTLLENPLVL